MRCQKILAATALLLAAFILQCSAQGRVGRPPRPPSTPAPPPPPPYPTAQPISLTVGSNQCIEAASPLRNGAKLVQARCSSTSRTQRWIVLNVGAGLRIMSNVDPSFCWNAWPLYDNAPPGNGGDYGSDDYDGAIRLWKCSTFDDDGQLFKPIGQANGWSLMPKFSMSKCATLVANNTETLLELVPCNGSASQTFLFNGLMPPAAASPPPATSSPPATPPPPSPSPPSPPTPPPPAKAGKKSPPPSSPKPSPSLSSPPATRTRPRRLQRLA